MFLNWDHNRVVSGRNPFKELIYPGLRALVAGMFLQIFQVVGWIGDGRISNHNCHLHLALAIFIPKKPPLLSIIYIYHLDFLTDPSTSSTFSGSIRRTFLSKSRIILLSHPQIRAERRCHLGTCEHDRSQTLGLNSEGEARGSLPWENDGDDMERKMGGFMEFP